MALMAPTAIQPASVAYGGVTPPSGGNDVAQTTATTAASQCHAVMITTVAGNGFS